MEKHEYDKQTETITFSKRELSALRLCFEIGWRVSTEETGHVPHGNAEWHENLVRKITVED